METQDARFSLDGRLLVTTADAAAKVWDPSSGRLLRTLGARSLEAFGYTFTNGSHVLTVDDGGRATLRAASSGRTMSELRGAASPELLWGNAEISPDGRWVVAQAEKRSPRLWDGRTGRVAGSLGTPVADTPGFDSGGFAFSRDSRLLLVSSEGQTSLWRTSPLRRLRTYAGAGEVSPSAFSSEGRLFATRESRQVSVWEVGRDRRVSRMLHPGNVADAAFSPDGAVLATAGTDGVTRIWETATGRNLGELRGHGADVRQVGFSARGDSVVTASGDGTARIWRARLDREPRPLRQEAMSGRRTSTAREAVCSPAPPTGPRQSGSCPQGAAGSFGTARATTTRSSKSR